MKKRELTSILDERRNPMSGDPILAGLLVMQEYFPGERVLMGATQYEVYSMRAASLRKRGLTREHAEILRDAGWEVNEYGVLVHSV